jgi:hypothetical protein
MDRRDKLPNFAAGRPVCPPRTPGSAADKMKYVAYNVSASTRAALYTAAAQPGAAFGHTPPCCNAKLKVLERLKELGVWLVDACVAGIYDPSIGRRYDGATYAQLVCGSFERFVAPEFAEDKPEVVCVVGKRVWEALAGLRSMQDARWMWMYQPNAPGKLAPHRRQLAELTRLVHEA